MNLSSLSSALVAVLISAQSCGAFTAPPASSPSAVAAAAAAVGAPGAAFLPRRPPSAFFAVSDDDEDGPPPLEPTQSFLEGNRRVPTARELSVMDDMITKLSNAKPYELPQAVSKAIRVVSSPRFFLRIAERADMTDDALEKAKLASLSENLVTTLEAVVSTTEDRLDERAEMVESVVKAAAEPDSGEFLVPLSAERVAAMREALADIESPDLDEGFLSTVDAWMNKSHQDGMDGMVAILQKVLQLYAGVEIKRARARLQASVGAAVSGQSQGQADEVVAEQEKGETPPAAALLERLMDTDPDSWDAELRRSLAAEQEEGGVSSQAIMGEVQRTIEGVVLGLENGSMAQRVQAEYLRELVTRIEALEQAV